MPYLSDTERMHELLACLMLFIMLITFAIVLCYLCVLGAFFRELKKQEPDVWQQIGSPGLLNMLLIPRHQFRKFYAYMPILKERARAGGYRHAARAWWLRNLSLWLIVGMFCVTTCLLVWIFLNSL